MHRSAPLLTLLLAGCSAPTSLVVHLDLDSGFVPTVQTAEVTLSTGAKRSQGLDATARTLTVLLPDAALDVTVLVSDTNSAGKKLSGSVTARSVPRRSVERTLCLGSHCSAPPAADLAVTHDLALADLSASGDLALPPCGGPSRCASSGVALCEDFESALAAPWEYRVTTGAGFKADDTTHVCRGTRAAHLTTPAVGAMQAASYLFEKQLLPSSTLFVRSFLYAPSQSWPAPVVTLLQAFQLQSPFGSDEIWMMPSGVLQQVASNPNFVGSSLSPSPLPMDRWVCVEWEIVPSTSATGALHMWIDDAPVPIDLTNAVTQSSPALGAVAVGMDFTPNSSSGPLDLWIDEVAIDTQRIGCTR